MRAILGLMAAALTGVAVEQFALVDTLYAALGSTIARVQDLASLSERLERRTAERRPVSGRVTFTVGTQRVEAALADLSAGGLRCLLSGRTDLRPGATGDLRAVVDGQVVVTPGHVTRHRDSDDGGSELGIAFGQVSPEARRTIDALVAGVPV